MESICREAGAFQLTHFGQIHSGQISDKGLNQLVSFVDIETEKLLVQKLEKLVPHCKFVTEEGTENGLDSASKTWIIDPLDGTTNFLHGLGAFSISVALYEGNEAILGVVYVPIWDEMFSALKGNGAKLNGNPISVAKTTQLKESLIATGFPYYEFDQMEAYLGILKELMQKTHGLRRMGSAAIDLAYTACGRFDGFFELGLSPWDVAAGILIVEEAGGRVSDFVGGNNFLYGKSILASSAGVYEPLQQTILTHFSE